jgi:hypothetical protein
MKIDHLTATLPDAEVIKYTPLMDEDLTVPVEGEFIRMKHDWQTAVCNYKPRQLDPDFEQHNLAMPAAVPEWSCQKFGDFIEVQVSWQQRIYELFRYAVGPIPADGEVEYWYIEDPNHHHQYITVPAGTLHAYPHYPIWTLRGAYMDFISDHRAMSDSHAYDTQGKWFRDDIIHVNPENTKYWSIKCLTFTGNIFHKIPKTPDDPKGNLTAIETLDWCKPAPPLDWILENKPYLIQWCTEQSVYELPPVNGVRSWRVARFPQLKLVCRHYGLPEVGTPMFAVGCGGRNTLENDWIEPVTNKAAYSPYVPIK